MYSLTPAFYATSGGEYNPKGFKKAYCQDILYRPTLDEFIASCLSESPTGQIRLMESILERNNMRRAVSV